METRYKFWAAATCVPAFITAIFISSAIPCRAADAEQAKPLKGASQTILRSQDNQSLRNEIQHAIDRGLTWLTTNQNSNGWWQTSDHPAVTGLALIAFNGDPMDMDRGSMKNARWWEKEPALVTSYALQSLEMLWRGLGG